MKKIKISKEITLKKIKEEDYEELFGLMSTIYPPVYKHFWKEDNPDWYINSIYVEENLKLEVLDENSMYYFIEYDTTKIGIIRLLDNCSTEALNGKRGIKLHRIYLSPNMFGKNIGLEIINWAKQKAVELNKEVLWLEAMDTSYKVLSFYEKCGFETFDSFLFDSKRMKKKYRGMYRMQYKIQ